MLYLDMECELAIQLVYKNNRNIFFLEQTNCSVKSSQLVDNAFSLVARGRSNARLQ